MNEINADFALETDLAVDEVNSESNLMDIFFAELGRLKRIVAGMGLNISDAEDVLQDVSIRAFEHSGRYEDRQDCVKWLIKVTVNECLMEHRRRKSFLKRTGEILKKRLEIRISKTTDEKVIVAEELEIVRACLKKLDDSLLVPLVLQYFCNLNSKEIGRILELNPSTVRSRLRDGRMILAKELLERGIEP